MKVLRNIFNSIEMKIPIMLARLFPNYSKQIWERLFLKNGLKPIKIITDNFFVLHPLDKSLSRTIFIYKQVYPEIYRILKTYSIMCNSFIDIGANIGYFTVTIGQNISKRGQVIAVEPEPSNILLLKKKLKINNINASIEQVALSNKEGVADFCINETNRGGHSLNDPLGTFKGRKIQVKTTTINKLIRKYELIEPILIKIDVEGFEYFLFEGADDLLEKNCVIVTEFTPTDYIEQGFNPIVLLEKFTKFGYRIYDINLEKRIAPKDFNLVYNIKKKFQTNLLLVRNI